MGDKTKLTIGKAPVIWMVTTDGSVSILTLEYVSVTRSVTASVHVNLPALGTVSVTEMLAVSGSARPQTDGPIYQ